MIIPINNELAKQIQAFRHELLKNPKILNVTAASSIPTQIGNVNGIDWWDGKPDKEIILMRFVIAQHDYLDTLGMRLIEGRIFSRTQQTDISNFIVNELFDGDRPGKT